MKTILNLVFCFEVVNLVMSSPVIITGLSQPRHLNHMQHPKGYRALSSKNNLKRHSKHKTTEAPGYLSTQHDFDSYVENISPEYRYLDVEKSQTKERITPSHRRLVHQSGEPKSVYGGVGGGLSRGVGASLEHLNMILQNTMPEYKYDKPFRPRADSCADLDPDCRKYEMDGLCSDNPDFAQKRFNCKKTCHLCHGHGVHSGVNSRKKT